MIYRYADLIPYAWSVTNDSGYARAYFTITPRNRVHLVFMELYDHEQKLKGNVERKQMNLRTILSFEAYVSASDSKRYERLYDLDGDGFPI